MRHRKHTVKLNRKSQHRRSLLANLVCALIDRGMILTTLAKAKAARPLAEKMVTLAKHSTLHSRRLATARLGQKDSVTKLFTDIAPRQADRKGGYTRITKLGRRSSDAAEMALLEWVGLPVETSVVSTADAAEKPKKEPAKEEAPAKA